MTRRPPKSLPLPTERERADAAIAAAALRAAIADPSLMCRPSVMYLDLARPRRGECWTTWSNLPGFVRVNNRYRHTLLPGWEYARSEVLAELIPDLEALAKHGIRPIEATSGAAA